MKLRSIEDIAAIIEPHVTMQVLKSEDKAGFGASLYLNVISPKRHTIAEANELVAMPKVKANYVKDLAQQIRETVIADYEEEKRDTNAILNKLLEIESQCKDLRNLLQQSGKMDDIEENK